MSKKQFLIATFEAVGYTIAAIGAILLICEIVQSVVVTLAYI